MVEKYALTQIDRTVIMKFNFLKMELIIGGYSKHRTFIESIIEEYWEVQSMPEIQFPQRNKIRYTLRCVPAKYTEIVKRITAGEAIIIERIHAHGRLL